MKTPLGKILLRSFILIIALLFVIGSLLLPTLAAIAQTPQPRPNLPANLVKPSPNSDTPQARKRDIVQAGPPSPSTKQARGDKRQETSSGPYDSQSIRESYRSLYGS